MNALADHLLAFGVQATLLGIPLTIGLLLSLRLSTGMHPRARYIVACAVFGVIPLLAIALAVRPELDSGARNEHPTPTIVITPTSEVVDGSGATTSPTLAVASTWIAFALVLLAREIGGHVLLRQRSRTWSLDTFATLKGETLSIRLANSGTPMTVGLLRPEIVIPARALRELDRAVLDAIVAHERAHARWRDPFVHAAARMTRILLWPVLPLHVVGHVITREAEIAADYAACDAASREQVCGYASGLLETARWQKLAVESVAPSLTRVGLEGRIRRLFESSRPSLARLSTAILVLVAAGLTTAETPIVRPDSPITTSVNVGNPVERLVSLPSPAPSTVFGAEDSRPVGIQSMPRTDPGLTAVTRDASLPLKGELSRLATTGLGVRRPPEPGTLASSGDLVAGLVRSVNPGHVVADVVRWSRGSDSPRGRPHDDDEITSSKDQRIIVDQRVIVHKVVRTR